MKYFNAIISAAVLAVLGCACANTPVKDPDVTTATNIFFNTKKNPTPAMFFTDQYPSQNYHDAAMSLTNNRVPKDKARKLIQDYIKKAREDAKWSAVPPKVKIPYAENGIKIDGVIDPKEWNGACQFKGMYPSGSMTKDPDHEPVVRVLWDKTNLYISSIMKNDQYRKTGQQVYDADCLEMFIRIDSKLLLYWEVIVNFKNELLCDYRSINYWGGFAMHQLPPDVFPGLKYKGEVRDGIFYMEIAIPWRLIPGFNNVRGADSPKAGESVMFNLIPVFTKADNKTHFNSVVPLMYGGHNIYGQITGTLERN